MSKSLQRVVFDCNVYVQALINRTGPAGQCVTLALDGAVLLFISESLLQEIREAPERPSPARLGVTVEKVETLIENLLKVATVVKVIPPVFAYAAIPMTRITSISRSQPTPSSSFLATGICLT